MTGCKSHAPQASPSPRCKLDLCKYVVRNAAYTVFHARFAFPLLSADRLSFACWTRRRSVFLRARYAALPRTTPLPYRGRSELALFIPAPPHPPLRRVCLSGILAGWIVPKTLHWAAIDRPVVEEPTGKAADRTRSSSTANWSSIRKKRASDISAETGFIRVCKCVLYEMCVIPWCCVNGEMLKKSKYGRAVFFHRKRSVTDVCSATLYYLARYVC